jgi:hypothetical protein
MSKLQCGLDNRTRDFSCGYGFKIEQTDVWTVWGYWVTAAIKWVCGLPVIGDFCAQSTETW